jgi:hypothetical protein
LEEKEEEDHFTAIGRLVGNIQGRPGFLTKYKK